MAVVCNVLWGSAFPFIKLGYRLFAIDSADTASILCFAGVRFMIGAALVWLAGLALNHRPLPMPRGKTLASACGLGLWQTAAQYFFYYSAVALLTGAMGGILNSTASGRRMLPQSFAFHSRCPLVKVSRYVTSEETLSAIAYKNSNLLIPDGKSMGTYRFCNENVRFTILDKNKYYNAEPAQYILSIGFRPEDTTSEQMLNCIRNLIDIGIIAKDDASS